MTGSSASAPFAEPLALDGDDGTKATVGEMRCADGLMSEVVETAAKIEAVDA
jgi:hypothetical protein